MVKTCRYVHKTSHHNQNDPFIMSGSSLSSVH